MRMNTTLVINPKGGSGKTTVAINLASQFAANNVATTLMDYDPQGSSLNWLQSRPPHAARIHAANGAPERFGRRRSFEMYVPPETRQLIIDAPAGASGLLLHEMLDRAHCVIVPVIPSVIDIHATGNFIKDLLVTGKVRTGDIRLAVVANKVRISMPAYQPLLRFLNSVDLKLLTRLIDSDMYVRAAETGVGIFEMDPGMSAAERKQFTPIVEWVAGEHALSDARTDPSSYEPAPIRRVTF